MAESKKCGVENFTTQAKYEYYNRGVDDVAIALAEAAALRAARSRP